MHKVVLIDDEEIIRKGLRTLISWEDYGYEVIGEAVDGEQGERLILELQPDLVLADIRMPLKSGLEMLSDVRGKGYTGNAIILTGFGEFNYAKEAISLDVAGYLLKPIEEDELIHHLQQIKIQLGQTKKLQEVIRNHETMALVDVGRKLLHGNNSRTVPREVTFFSENSMYQVVIINALGEAEEEAFLKTYFINMSHHCVVDLPGSFVFIFRDKTSRQLRVILSDLQKHSLHHYGQMLFITVGGVKKGVQGIRGSYLEAQGLLERQFAYTDKNLVFSEEQVQVKMPKAVIDLQSEYLFGLIEIGNLPAMEVYLSKLSHQFINSSMKLERIKAICYSCMVEVKEKIVHQYSEAKYDLTESEQMIHKIFNQESLEDIIEYMKGVLEGMSKRICDGSSDNTIKRFLNYIDTNYYKDLKLEGLAKLFNYSPSYLGKIFKQSTGVYFNAYLDRVRIDQAKAMLLKGEGKVYQVAEKVGYTNVNYFYAKFKKYIGMSPKEYKESHNHEDI